MLLGFTAALWLKMGSPMYATTDFQAKIIRLKSTRAFRSKQVLLGNITATRVVSGTGQYIYGVTLKWCMALKVLKNEEKTTPSVQQLTSTAAALSLLSFRWTLVESFCANT